MVTFNLLLLVQLLLYPQSRHRTSLFLSIVVSTVHYDTTQLILQRQRTILLMRSQIKQIGITQMAEDLVLRMQDLQMHAQYLWRCDYFGPASLGLELLALPTMDILHAVLQRGDDGLLNTGVVEVNSDAD